MLVSFKGEPGSLNHPLTHPRRVSTIQHRSYFRQMLIYPIEPHSLFRSHALSVSWLKKRFDRSRGIIITQSTTVKGRGSSLEFRFRSTVGAKHGNFGQIDSVSLTQPFHLSDATFSIQQSDRRWTPQGVHLISGTNTNNIDQVLFLPYIDCLCYFPASSREWSVEERRQGDT